METMKLIKGGGRFGRITPRFSHNNMTRCVCCKTKEDFYKMVLFKDRYYCRVCFPGVKLAHDVIDQLRREDVQD